MKGVSSKVKKLTAGAMLSAMGVALLFLGSLFETVDLTMAALASFACLFAVLELGGIYPWLIFAVTGVLGIILAPKGVTSMAGWYYILFFGYYPILKEKYERLKKPLSWVLKLVTLNIALVICVLLVYFITFGASSDKNLFDAIFVIFGGEGAGTAMIIGIYLLLNVTLVVYDIALTMLISTYINKWRHRFKFLR